MIPIRTVGELRRVLEIRTPKHLGFLLLASAKRGGPYKTHEVPKRGGGVRKICVPCGALKAAQRKILDRILVPWSPHRAAHGFVPGRSIVTAGLPHVGSELIVKFDLKDFFPTVGYWRVMGLFADMGYPMSDRKFDVADASDRVAPTLARLCCFTSDSKLWGSGFLPQGAPTSPALTNLACRRMDARLEGAAAASGGVYTRYADDLTFSFKSARKVSVGKLKWVVNEIVQGEGFLVNWPKFRIASRGDRQLVLGSVVNDVLQPPKHERRRVRAILHNCKMAGVAAQAARHPAYAAAPESFAAHVGGLVSYARMLRPGLFPECEDSLRS